MEIRSFTKNGFSEEIFICQSLLFELVVI